MMLVDRRQVLRYSLASAALTILPSTLTRSESGPEAVTLCLLGTKGGPSVRDINQLPFSNLLRIGSTSYIIDAGYGTTYRLIEKGISLASIRCIFVSHHHSDHNFEVGPLLFNAWANGLNNPIDVYGPAGIDHLIKAYLDSNKIDIDIRIVDEGRPDLRTLVAEHAFKEGLVMEDQNVRVSALRVLHPPIEAYALKFEIKGGKTLVFSGDTAYFPPLAEFAKNADFMVHEVMYGPALDRLVKRNPAAKMLMDHLRAAHTLTEDVGRIAAAANVKTLVLSHFVPGADAKITDDDWIAGIRKSFAGNVIVGRDRLEIAIN